jgi:hypothetical protein
MVTFKPASRVVGCKTLHGAQKLATFLTEKFTGNPRFTQNIFFRSIIETSNKVSVHASIQINEAGHQLFKEAIAEFKAQFTSAAA